MGILASKSPLACCTGSGVESSALKRSYDYIIIGGGSAGACLAARLSEDPSKTVLLLEAGPDATDVKLPLYPLAVTIPGIAQLLQSPTPVTSRFDYHFVSAPNLDLTQGQEPGRKVFQPRGYIVGGSSCLNYMLWVRGGKAFYDKEWGVGWSWQDVEPAFKAVESYHGAGAVRDDRGKCGPTYTMDAADWNAIPKANRLFQEASQKVSIENNHQPNTDINADYNNPNCPLGVGAAQWNIKCGERQSTAVAYLTEAVRRRKNLSISDLSFVTRVNLEERGCDKVATGVKFKKGRANLNEKGPKSRHVMTALECAPEFTVKAEEEIVLCGGALQSPQLLMLSGIGDRAQLEQHNIAPIVHLPEVGMNLQDHLFVATFFEITDESAFNSGLRMLSGSLVNTLLFTSLHGGAIPDVQFHLTWSVLDSAALTEFLFSLPMNLTSKYFTKYLPEYAKEKPVCCLLPSLIQPKSKGKLSLYSGNPLAYPKADFKYLSEKQDVETLMHASNLLRRIVRTSPMCEILGKEVVNPELPNSCHPMSPEYNEAYIRSAATCIYHPCGTCAKGKVVDHELKVQGVKGLRVADASIMPVITPGNTNWPSIMIGERAASLIRGTEPVCQGQASSDSEQYPRLLGASATQTASTTVRKA